jgi:hypothetical protein
MKPLVESNEDTKNITKTTTLRITKTNTAESEGEQKD